ncbi:MAG TPA: hypothetical protein VEU55_04975 [Gemmatimonadales bacterium]|nr:hypothetical protein [Gemmatimonadales bacterium]
MATVRSPDAAEDTSSSAVGTLWVRTRNLLALAIIDAAGDLLPNLADVIRWWRPGA